MVDTMNEFLSNYFVLIGSGIATTIVFVPGCTTLDTIVPNTLLLWKKTIR